MSDLGFPIPKPGFQLLESFSRPSAFLPDVRFGDPCAAVPVPFEPEHEATLPEDELPDPVALAYTQGFAAGHEQASAEARADAEAEAAAREGLALAIVKLDAELEEELRLRLRETVAALCEAALAPLALDEDALMHRIDKAVSMLARADDERVIRLNPKDIALLSDRLRAEWEVEGDPALERGSIRVESNNGGVEDGPDTWRRVIAEALQQI